MSRFALTAVLFYALSGCDAQVTADELAFEAPAEAVTMNVDAHEGHAHGDHHAQGAEGDCPHHGHKAHADGAQGDCPHHAEGGDEAKGDCPHHGKKHAGCQGDCECKGEGHDCGEDCGHKQEEAAGEEA